MEYLYRGRILENTIPSVFFFFFYFEFEILFFVELFVNFSEIYRSRSKNYKSFRYFFVSLYGFC